MSLKKSHPTNDSGPSENTARILDQIRRSGDTTRVELAAALDLSAATVSTIVSGLLDQQLVRETQVVATPGRGRPRIQLTLNASARFVAGAKLNTDSLTMAILNFAGDVIFDKVFPFGGPTISPEKLNETLEGAFNKAVSSAGLDVEQIAAFGMGIPGFVELETGLCHWSPVLLGAPLNVRDLIQQVLPCPVNVDNDANLATLAEVWFGHGRRYRNFLVVTIEHGVGLGVVLDQKLYRGARGLGAEFGHTKVQHRGALCRCGQRGCLEAYVADFALVREANTALRGFRQDATDAQIIDRLAARARVGDPGPLSIFNRAGEMLAMGLANLVNLFDPSVIILAGERMRNHDLMVTSLERLLRENAIRPAHGPVPVETHRWGDGLWARGAGALAITALNLRTQSG